MKKRLLLGASIVLVAIGLVVFFLSRKFEPAQQGAPGSASSQQSAPARVLPEPNKKLLESALNSKTKAEQALALVPDARAFDWNAVDVLPKGSVLTLDSSSFVANEANQTATVKAVVTSGASREFVLYLVWVEENWLITPTKEVE